VPKTVPKIVPKIVPMTEVIIAARFVQFAAVMLLFGTSLLRWYIDDGRDAQHGARTREAFDGWLRKVLLVAAVLTLISALAWLDGVVMTMGDGWSDALDVEVLTAVLFDTWFGQVWMWRLMLAAALIVTLLVTRKPPGGVLERGAILALSGTLVVSLALTGHTALASGGTRMLHIASQATHLLAGAVWLGGLVPLGYLLAKALTEPQGAWLAMVRHVLPRFSRLGYAAVGLLIVTGCINGWVVIGRWDALLTTTHGRVLLAKVLLFALMVGLAIVNRLWLAPRLLAVGPHGPAPLQVLAALQRNVASELILALLILAAVGLLGTLPPAT